MYSIAAATAAAATTAANWGMDKLMESGTGSLVVGHATVCYGMRMATEGKRPVQELRPTNRDEDIKTAMEKPPSLDSNTPNGPAAEQHPNSSQSSSVQPCLWLKIQRAQRPPLAVEAPRMSTTCKCCNRRRLDDDSQNVVTMRAARQLQVKGRNKKQTNEPTLSQKSHYKYYQRPQSETAYP